MNNKKQRVSRGQSIVEVALVLPILVMMLMGLLDFGRAYYAVVALRDAADEGASYAVMNRHDEAGIKQRASEASPALVTIPPEAVTVQPALGVALSAGDPITVTTVFTLELFTPFANVLVSDSQLTLRGRAVHAALNPYTP